MTPTNDTFEDRLLDALLDRFDNLAYQTPAATRSVERRAGRRLYAIPLAGLAIGATAASLSLVEIDGSTAAHRPGPGLGSQPASSSYALSAWTARPTSANPAQTSAAEAHCSASAGQPGAGQTASGDKQGPTLGGGAWSSVIVDTRGNLTLALYSDGSATMACLASPSFVWLNPIDSSPSQLLTETTARLDEVTIRGGAGDVYTIAVGRAGSAVTGVQLQRVDGSAVTATVSDGRFIAWWPEREGVTALSVTTSNGTQDYPVDHRFAQSNAQPTNKTVRSLPDQPTNKAS